jgi:hypothetical protein
VVLAPWGISYVNFWQSRMGESIRGAGFSTAG